MIRLPDAQRWPALEKAERQVHFTAASRSASSQTTSGFLPPSSSDTFLSSLPQVSPIDAADGGRAGEGDHADQRMLDERRAGLGAETVHQVEDARRQAALCEDRGEEMRRARRLLGALEHDRIAADQRRKGLPAQIGDRRVGRNDGGRQFRHGRRTVIGIAVGGAGGRGAAVEPLSFAGVETGEGDTPVGFTESVARRLARSPRRPRRRSPPPAFQGRRRGGRAGLRARRRAPRAQAAGPLRAACTAESTSTAADRGATASTLPSCGERFSNVAPDRGGNGLAADPVAESDVTMR